MIDIRKATLEDLDQLVPLFDAYRVWYRKESKIEAAKTFLQERLTKNDSVIFCCFKNNEALGFTQLYPSFSSTRMKRLWILNDLYISPEARGQGYSKKLIDKTKSFALETDACGILLETETSNLIGNKLYPRMGFDLEQNNFYFWTAKN